MHDTCTCTVEIASIEMVIKSSKLHRSMVMLSEKLHPQQTHIDHQIVSFVYLEARMWQSRRPTNRFFHESNMMIPRPVLLGHHRDRGRGHLLGLRLVCFNEEDVRHAFIAFNLNQPFPESQSKVHHSLNLKLPPISKIIK